MWIYFYTVYLHRKNNDKQYKKIDMTITLKISKGNVMKRAHGIFKFGKEYPRYACKSWAECLKRAWELEKEEAKSREIEAKRRETGYYDIPVELVASYYGRRNGAYCGD